MNMNINWKLPEDIIGLIFSKLPFPNLSNCRIVCRAWNDLILGSVVSSSKLLNAFILNTISCDYDNAEMHCIDLNTASSVAMIRSDDETFVKIINSCNGLLPICKSIFKSTSRCYGIWNPMTNEFFQVPILQQILDTHGSGFGFSPKTKQYKLFGFFYGKESPIVVKVLRFGIGRELQWSDIVGCQPTFKITGLGTYLDGVIYWIESNVIYGLDVETETFETVAVLDFGPYFSFAYTEAFNDTICVIEVAYKNRQLGGYGNRKVWVMRAKHLWIKEFVICLPNSFDFYPIQASKDEGKLYFVGDNDLFCVDKIGKMIKIKTLFNLTERKVVDFLSLQSLNFGSLPKILG